MLIIYRSFDQGAAYHCHSVVVLFRVAIFAEVYLNRVLLLLLFKLGIDGAGLMYANPIDLVVPFAPMARLANLLISLYNYSADHGCHTLNYTVQEA